MSITRIVATYNENPQDSITLLCGVDSNHKILAGEWFGVVKNNDGQGDESNYPFTLHIDYQTEEFFIDYGYDELSNRQVQRIDIQLASLRPGAEFSVFDDEEQETFTYSISSLQLSA